MKTKSVFACLVLITLAACGDKVPESKASKEVGNIPKQTLDKAVSGTENAMQKSEDRNKSEDQKQ
jgi:predicted small lipoprotein YifL